MLFTGVNGFRSKRMCYKMTKLGNGARVSLHILEKQEKSILILWTTSVNTSIVFST